MNINDINPMDFKFIMDKPEDGFSPERNKAIIEKTIKKYEANRARKIAQFREGVHERADALATWAKSMSGWQSGKPADRYFGRKMVAYLRGDDIRRQLMNNVIQRDTFDLTNKLNGKK